MLASTHDPSTLVCASPHWSSVEAALPARAAWTDRERGEPIVDGRSTWVRRLATDAGTFFLKCYEYRSWRDRLRNCAKWTAPLRASRAARECAAYRWLTERGFHGPAHFACLERRQAGFLSRAVLVTSAVDGVSAERLLETCGPDERRQTAVRIGSFVRALHRAGFRDRNLDLRNLIVSGDRVVKIDSPRHRLVRPGDRADALTRADWARLLPQLDAFGVRADAEQAD